MRPRLDFNNYIFDCDGVIFDSNRLKINAMKESLQDLGIESLMLDESVNHFSRNFGLSRYNHAKRIAEINGYIDTEDSRSFQDALLSKYSKKCRELYLKADITPGFLEFHAGCNGLKFVASGSNQEELVDVFVQRGLCDLFDGIYGSPTPKKELVKNIVENTEGETVLIGDAVADFDAAVANSISFVFYTPFSTAFERMQELRTIYGFPVIDDFKEELTT